MSNQLSRMMILPLLIKSKKDSIHFFLNSEILTPCTPIGIKRLADNTTCPPLTHKGANSLK